MTAATAGRRERWEPWVVFAVVHVLLAAVAPLAGAGDVTLVYQHWFTTWAHGGTVVGVQTDWVYPILALGPVLAAGVVPGAYLAGWLCLVTALDAVAFAAVLRRDPAAARWWMLFLLALGPVAICRIDSVAAPLVLLGGVLLARRPRVASALLTLAAWIKVWPAAAVLAALVTGPRRWWIALTAAATTALVVVGDAVLGGATHLLSFLGQQTGRGLEFEAPVTTIWLWLGAFGRAHVRTAFDPVLLDVEVIGDGTAQAAAATTVLMLLLVLTVTTVGLLVARRRGADAVRLFPALLLALVLVLITANKVGSPQYATWIAPAVVLGLLVDGTRFAAVRLPVLVLAVLTQLAAYTAFLGWGVPTIVVLTARNAGYVALLAAAVVLLVRACRSAPAAPTGRATGRVVVSRTPSAR